MPQRPEPDAAQIGVGEDGELVVKARGIQRPDLVSDAARVGVAQAQVARVGGEIHLATMHRHPPHGFGERDHLGCRRPARPVDGEVAKHHHEFLAPDRLQRLGHDRLDPGLGGERPGRITDPGIGKGLEHHPIGGRHDIAIFVHPVGWSRNQATQPPRRPERGVEFRHENREGTMLGLVQPGWQEAKAERILRVGAGGKILRETRKGGGIGLIALAPGCECPAQHPHHRHHLKARALTVDQALEVELVINVAIQRNHLRMCILHPEPFRQQNVDPAAPGFKRGIGGFGQVG